MGEQGAEGGYAPWDLELEPGTPTRHSVITSTRVGWGTGGNEAIGGSEGVRENEGARGSEERAKNHGGELSCPPDVASIVEINSEQLIEGEEMELDMEPRVKQEVDEERGCDICFTTFPDEQTLWAHRKLHAANRKLCDIDRKSHGGVRDYICDLCGKHFLDSLRLRMHQLSHSVPDGGQVLSCEQCGCLFGKESSLEKHRESHQEAGRAYFCLLCGKRVGTRSALLVHTDSHAGESGYSCGACSRPFPSHSALKRHLRTHTAGEHPFECEFCGCCYRDENSLRNHRQIHTGEKPFTCNGCGKRFSLKHQLETHYRVHTACAVQVNMLDTWKVVMLFQPVRLRCQFSTSSTAGTEPIVTWKYKSFCRDRIADVFNPSSSTQQINSQMQQADPNYNVYTDCPDSSREVRNIATKQGSSITLGAEYQARRITIVDQATLSLERAGWGDSGVYYCQVISVKDLTGNNEGFAEVLVLDWLFVVLVALAGIILIILLSICWCQCCPHTCPCYVRCPCCPERCCCPRALYEAGKAATGSYAGSHAPITFTPMPGMYPYNANPAISDMDGGSSVGNSSRAPLLPFDDGSNSTGRNTYLQHDASGPRVLYVTERELSNMRPPSVPAYHYEFDRMTEISSLHEGRSRERERDRADSSLHMALREARERALPPLSDLSEGESDEEWQRSRHGQMRARSMEVLDDWGRERRRGEDRSRGRGRRSPSPSGSDDHYYPSVQKGKGRMKDFESDSRNGRLPPKSSAMSRSYESALDEPQRSPRSHPNSRTPPTSGPPPSYRSDDVDSRSGSAQGKKKRKGLQGRESLRV